MGRTAAEPAGRPISCRRRGIRCTTTKTWTWPWPRASCPRARRRHFALTRADRRRGTGDADDERFHLLTGFNDIFVVIAGVLLLLAVGWLGSRAAPWVGALAVSAVAWALAEFFVRVRRTALIAIVLLLAFLGGIVVAICGGTAMLIGGALLVLSAFWHRSRQALVSRLPDTLRARLAPLH